MLARSTIIATLVAGTALLAGCADTPALFGSSANLTTASVATPAVAKTDPACAGLAAQMDGLRKEGITEKIEKAANGKYKMTKAELGKADQLNKVNVDFQGKCSSFKPATAAMMPAPASTASTATAAITKTADAVKAAPAAAKEAIATAAAAAKP
jgi:hypothetical protein